MAALCCAAAIFLSVSSPAGAASGTAILSRSEVPIRVIRQADAMDAVQGHRLQSGDFIEVQEGKYAQIELADDFLIAVQGSARLALQKADAGKGRPLHLQLLEGWVKIQPFSDDSSAPLIIDTRNLHVTLRTGSVLIRASAEQTAVFSEASAPRVSAVDGSGRVGAEQEMGREQLAVRIGSEAIKIKPRPDPDFIKAIPGDLRDSLVAVSSKLKGDPPKQLPQPVSFAEAEPWLTAGGGLRRGLVARFQSRAHDARFRAELAARLAQLPEWRDILYPPPPRKPAAVADGAGGSTAEHAAMPVSEGGTPPSTPTK